MDKNILKKFYIKLKIEAILKSIIIGLLLSSLFNVILLLSVYFINSLYLTAGIILCVISSIITILLLYVFKFSKVENILAKRVDEIGLKERVVTMIEFQNDDSYIAKLQREDTLNELNKISSSSLKFLISKKTISFSSIATLLTICISCITIFTAVNILNYSFSEIENKYTVNYEAQKGGYIDGEIFQYIFSGNETTSVTAVCEYGYIFDSWSDGIKTQSRKDVITENIEVTAIFRYDSLSGGIVPDSDGPSMDFDDMTGTMPDIAGGAGQYEDYNQVIDGDTYYKDVYDQYYNQALEMIENGDEVPEYLKQIILLYFGIII